MKAIIHIGMMKTGSTSIKTWLSSNFAALKAQGVLSNQDAGVFGKIPAQNGLKYAACEVALREFGVDENSTWLVPRVEKIPGGMEKMRDICKLMTDQLENLSGKIGILIYCDEVIYRFSKIQMIALEQYLSRFFEEITYVIYIRNTVDFLVSMYTQKLHNSLIYAHGTQNYIGFFEFLKNCASGLVPFGLESSFGNLFDWSNVLGDRLNVRLLESEWLVNNDLIEDFASLVGVPAFEKPDRMNEAFAAEYVEYVRYLNSEYRNILPSATRLKSTDILKLSSSGKPKLAASDAQAKLIHDLHREQEEKIRKVFFPDRPFLFSPKLRNNGTTPTPLTERRKVKIGHEIQVSLAPEVWSPYEFACNGLRGKLNLRVAKH